MKIDDKLISKPPYAGPERLKPKKVNQKEIRSLISKLFRVTKSQESEETGNDPVEELHGN